MKLPVDKSLIATFGRVCQYGLANCQAFDDLLLQRSYQEALESLIVKLAKGKTAIRPIKSIRVTAIEAMMYRCTIEIYSIHQPEAMEVLVSKEYFLNPINKQLVEPKF